MVERILFGVAALLFAFALWLGIAFGARYMLFGEKAVGTVVELIDDGSTIGPVVEFATRNGEIRRYHGLGSSESDYYLGERVAIRYFDDDPAAARISSSFHELWLPALAVGIFAAIFAAVAALVRRMERKVTRAAAARKLPGGRLSRR